MQLDTTLLKVQAGLDNFITEKYADQIERILAGWSSGLLQSPQELGAIGGTLAPDFSGCSFQPVEPRVVRSSAGLEIRKNRFTQQAALGRDAFLKDLRSALSVFAKVITAEFQVTSVEALPGGGLHTRVRYDLVGSGEGCYREQRMGEWDLGWTTPSEGEYRLKKWLLFEETQSRTSNPVFVDMAAQAFGANASYSAQLLKGADHWRTVLDGASGIDIYGHNGVSVGDIDDDGFDDLYVCQPGGLPNRLYRNRGDGTFEDITEQSGLGLLENTACALFADIDNDGRQDLIVVCTSGPQLFLNQGDGQFRPRPNAFQFARPPQGTFTGAAVADYDCDGWLDIYFCLYLYYQGTGQYKYPSPYFDAENGPPNFLMRNQRDGTFRDVTAETGLNQNNRRYSFCCGWSDYNRDGWPDLYVVNDFGRKNLYRNNGDGTFTDVAAQAGVEDVGAGMSVCWLDHDNDGVDDLYVANMWTAAGQRVSMQDVFQESASGEVRALYQKHAMGNSLLRNNGDGTFRDTSRSAEVAVGRWAWSSDSWDFDHDGFPDLYVTNGMVSGPSHKDLNSFFWRQVVANSPEKAQPAHDYEQGWSAINELIRSDETWSGHERNVFYANTGDGTFSDVSGVVGLDFLEDGRAFALADFDHDGRLEVFLKNRDAPQLRLLKNVMKDLDPSIAFRLRGTKSNRDAIGAAVTVETELGRQTRMLQAGSGFLSQHSKDVFFGLGKAQGPVRASVRWPSGLFQELHDLPVNHRVRVTEGSAAIRTEPFSASPSRLEPASSKGLIGTAEVESSLTSVESWLLSPIAAPDVALPDLTGQTRRLSTLRGKPVLLNLWATESLNCETILLLLNQMHSRWAVQGLHLLTMNLDSSGSPDKVRDFARERRFSFPVVLASDDTAAIYNILYRFLFDRHRDLTLPTSFLIDGDGDIVKVYQGPVTVEAIEEDFRHIPRSAAERLVKALPFPGVTDVTEFPRNYLSYGSVYYQRGYFGQAEASFRLALRDDPSSAEALYGLGSACLEQQKNAEARESFERAVKLHASYSETLPNAWNNLGLLATREGRTAEAIPYFLEALKLNPDHLVALDNLGNAYRQLRQWDDARRVLERALVVSLEDPEANYSLGMVFAQTDDADHAFEYLQKALKYRPGYPEALNNLGVLYLRTRRRDDAVAAFEECIRVAPTFDQSYMNLARVYALEGSTDKARSILQELLKQRPGHEQAQKALEQLSQ